MLTPPKCHGRHVSFISTMAKGWARRYKDTLRENENLWLKAQGAEARNEVCKDVAGKIHAVRLEGDFSDDEPDDLVKVSYIS